ncbi:carbon monoxide dehydrogenase large chain [bacterium BMS3Abin02]|nr:carbon monoxide dehydrogenase large chain [bacterium BMS3Abin02]HDL50325.1 xanthine dehydrogenase family protein molybdopterin-binding subunit [Actinomycetota bacterium]
MSTISVMGGIVRRKEDPSLIQGKGIYVDDIKRHGELVAAFVRSPFAAATINGIDASAALELDGVHAVYTADDVRHLGPNPAQVAVGTLRPLLADGSVHHVGEAVAMVIADNRYVAQDAADLVFVDYEPKDAVVDLKEAFADTVQVHEGASNTLLTWHGNAWWEGVIELPDPSPGIQAAKERDDTVVVGLEMVNQRLIPTAIEPRAVLAEWNSGYGSVELWTSSQIPQAVAGAIGVAFGIPSNKVRVVAPEVGGGFGVKLNVYPDEFLCCFASKELGRPVRWTETRREAGFASTQGRGWVGTATITGTRDGKILGYELEAICDMGAYTQNFTVAIPLLGLFVAPGQYDIPTSYALHCVVTNTPTTDAYRGAGRPEAAYYLERIIDAYAREIGMDPADVRKVNYWKPDQFPVTTEIGLTMDSGDYEKNLDALLDRVGYEDLKARRDTARAEGRLLGIGLSTYVEVCGFGPSALAGLGFSWAGYGLPTAFNGSGVVRVQPDGTCTVTIGTAPSGQGHETTWAQIVSDGLGIPMENIEVRHGDSVDSPMGVGTFGSRSIAVDGAATYEATKRVKEKAATIAGHLLEAAPEDIHFADGSAHVAGSPDRSVSWAQIAESAYQPHTLPEGVEGGLESSVVFSPPNATWPFGSHMALVEVDPETGDVDLLEYWATDDCGNVINPMIVDGQLHGGIAQGIAQALFEEAIYDDAGNLLTASMLDYPLPAAENLPMFSLDRTVTPTDVNPLGVKGIGEAGTIGSAQTIVNAVVDAVSHLGVKHIDMPLRPKRVWQAIEDARN